MLKVAKTLLLTLLAVVIVWPSDALANGLNFKDVTENSRAYKEVKYLADRQYMSGKTTERFGVNENVTRAEAAATIGRALNISATNQETSFKDVPKGYRFSGYIQELSKRNIITGYADGTFRPNDQLTRGQMAIIINRAFLSNPNVSIAEAEKRLMSLGISEGKADGTFGRMDKILRIDFAVFIARSVEPSFRPNVVKPPTEPVNPFTRTVYVTSEQSPLNVRSGRGMNYAVVGQLSFQTKVKAAYPVNGWTKIQYDGNKEGYVAEDYLSTTYPKPTPPKPNPAPVEPTPVPPITTNAATVGYVTSATLNVRSQANDSSAIVTKVTKGTELAVTSINGFWAEVTTPTGHKGFVHKYYIKLVNKKGNAVQNRIIVIDPGHGGSDPGAISGGANEKSITLNVSKKVADKLRRAGANVHMTRTGDTYPTLTQRTQFAKSKFAESFISIHANSASASASGTEVWIDTKFNANGAESRLLAQYVQNKIVQKVNMKDRGVKDSAFQVLRQNNIPAILIELGFITNSSDRHKMTSEEYTELFAQAIYEGIVQYYSGK
ncbi:N-acetylmuramoyl-L-alanine amidase [Savagea sp. SN6]|uniref:N-acetylmuramoyl-L-alanine amidase n=1 Tax=Savagea serpentis TaxID=2785297 RepID=A0A8J7GAC3_9BACL|nr:N-acetylmuramoyl-L-alanine amidase [Savagea serpentis]MBF4501104.1 N-acetylmuramoyl-L-alanine amidase [Savagea serpentis]